MPLGAVLALSWCGEVSLGGKHIIIEAAPIDVERLSSLAARYLENKTRLFFYFFRAPPLPVSPGLPEVDPTIDQNKRPG